MRCLALRHLLLVVALASPAVAETSAASGQPRRNIVFILSDDHRFDAMGFMGHPLARTPYMDTLAREGVHFRNALVTTALCSPSRASILTGLYTFRHRVIDNQRPIPAGTVFFPQYLQEAGYATAFIGKWHMGGDAGGGSDHPQPGFDHWVSFAGQGNYWAPHDRYTLNVDGRRVPQRGYITDELTDYAVEWLAKQNPAEQPFFLYLSHKAVHADFDAAPRHKGTLADVPIELPDDRATPETWQKLRPRWVRDQRNSWHGVDFPYHSDLSIEEYYRRYGETLRAVDDSIGRVMAQLEHMGILDETLIVYMSDNGFMFGEHGLIDKRVAYETSIRVPLLMRCPDLFPGGRQIDQVVANIDIAPTLMAVAGLPPAPHFDGLNFLPLARGESIPWRDEFLYVYYWEKNFPHSPTVFALRGERYKYITYYGVWDADELFDLQEDPTESHNLLYDPQHAGIAKAMEQRLYSKMEELGGLEIPLNPPRGGSQNKRLRERDGEAAAEFPQPFILNSSELESE